MTYKYYNLEDGNFVIDWDFCCRIIRSYFNSEHIKNSAAETPESRSFSFDPRNWGLPDLVNLTVDWEKVRNGATEDTMSSAFKLGAFAMFQKNGVDSLVRELQRMQLATRRNVQEFQDKQKAVSDKNYASMNLAIRKAETGLWYARKTRDISGGILIGIATVATGGATLAGMAVSQGAVTTLGIAAGTMLKTTAKYQDTEHNAAGVATVEAVQTLATSIIPMGNGAKIAVSFVGETGKALIEGQSVARSLGMGAAGMATTALGNKGKDVLNKVMDKVAVSVAVKVSQDLAKKDLQSRIKDIGRSVNTGASQAAGNSSPFLDSLTFEDQFLLKLAIIDEAKGVGRSWW
ncbi:MAG: hypothetical protein ABJA20_13795 [Novosphingobium sp.]